MPDTGLPIEDLLLGTVGPWTVLRAGFPADRCGSISELLRRCDFQVRWFGSVTVWRPARYPRALPNVNVISQKCQGVNDETVRA